MNAAQDEKSMWGLRKIIEQAISFLIRERLPWCNMTNRIKKNILYGTLTTIGFFFMEAAFGSSDFMYLGEWAGSSTVTINVLTGATMFFVSLVMWCKKKQ